MKIQDLRKLNQAELAAKLTEQRRELFDMRFQHATAQLGKTSSIPAAKKNIARVLTIMNEAKRSGK